MGDARQRAEWGRTLSLMCFVGGMFSKNPPRPLDLVPERYRPGAEARKPTPASRAARIADSKATLGAYFRFVGRKNRKRKGQ